MIPKGYVLLTTDGAKQALKAKVDAASYYFQSLEKDTLIFNQGMQIYQFKTSIKLLEIENKDLKRKGFWKDVEKWGFRIALIFLGGKQVKAW